MSGTTIALVAGGFVVVGLFAVGAYLYVNSGVSSAASNTSSPGVEPRERTTSGRRAKKLVPAGSGEAIGTAIGGKDGAAWGTLAETILNGIT